MEYVQMTLNDWMSVKNELEQELRNAAAGFVRIGYLLRKIEESEGYKNDGYKTLAEWAADNYGLSASQVSRFKKINERYSIDGYSKQLKLEYANYGQSKLTEMLTLSDEGMEMVSPEMKREDIREIKAFEKQAPTEGPDDRNRWIIEYIDAKGLERLTETKAYKDDNLTGMIEEVIPSGAGTFRFQKIMVSMFPDKIMVREFPNPPENMAWSDFFDVVRAELERRAEEKALEEEQKTLEAEEKMPTEAEEMPEKGQEMPTKEGETPAEAGKMPEAKQEAPAEEYKESDTESEENKESVTEEPAEDPVEEQPAEKEQPAAEEQPAAGEQLAAGTEETIAPAQSEVPPAPVNAGETPDPEEPEQVEIDEILPPPVETDRLTELKDKFGEALATLRVQLDSNNFENMEIVIKRLETLRERLISAKEEKS